MCCVVADDIPEAMPLLRAVIRECHRFLKIHPDPSVIYMNLPPVHRQSRSPDAMTPTEERLSRDWGGHDFDRVSQHTSPPPIQRRTSSGQQSLPSQKTTELPTAFHAIFGTTLFLMGTIVAADPSLLLPGEPEGASTYWLGALDVFETGENLPSRTDGTGDCAEDWRMAIVWGRTLVCLADAKVSHGLALAKARAAGAGASPQAYCALMNSSPFTCVEPRWPKDSPFHAIAACRPPVTRRMSLYSASAHDIMVLAMDQFSRGIFHMPHPHYSQTHNPPSHLFDNHHYHHLQPNSHYAGSHYNHESPSDPLTVFSRPKELFTIASEVLGVAERLGAGTQRQYWASWADSVFNQMKMEADMDSWRGPITSARGRCWLVMGSAPVEEMEYSLEKGDLDVLKGREAEDAREGLAMGAFAFLSRHSSHGNLMVYFLL